MKPSLPKNLPHPPSAPEAANSPEPPRRTDVGRGAWLAWALLLVPAALTLARALGGDRTWLLLVWGAYTPFVLLPAYVSLALAILGRQRVLGVASLLLVGVHLSALWPQAFSRDPAATSAGQALRVATMNGNAANRIPATGLRALAHHNPEVVCLQEVSPAWSDALRDEGWLDAYPHYHLEVREGVWGMALLSRRPLRDLRVRPLNEAHAIEATLDHEGAEVTLLCVHPAPPAAGLTPSHLSALGKILAWMREHRAHPALVLGDFNSTPYSEFAHAAREHMDDAHELAGPWGLGHTWPNEGLVYPPARLDHVFVSRSLGVRLTRRGLAAGSDHQPVIADVVLRDGP